MHDQLKISVIGAGALGTMYAAMLSASGQDVTLICRERDAETLRKGIRVTGIWDKEAYPRISAILPASDLVLVTVKAYDIPSAVRGISLKPVTTVVVIQNGLGGDEAAASILGPGHAAAGVAYCGATHLAPGEARAAGYTETVLGSVEPAVAERLPMVADILEKAGLKARITDDIRAAQWEKLFANVGINAVTAITGLRNGALAAIPELRSLVAEVVREAAWVAASLGIRTEGDPVENTFRVIRETGGNISSMLQDVRKGKRTEIDGLNGAICDLGKRAGIPTPYNDTLAALVKAIEQRRGNGSLSAEILR
ncbi:MAG: ketopantoate reductase family protein [Candidatus Latescibacterota bacterium]